MSAKMMIKAIYSIILQHRGTDEILEILKATDINSITPMEALQTLFDLKQKAQELE